MSATTGEIPAVVCPLCGKPAEQVHTPRYKAELPLYHGLTPTGFLASMAEGGPFGARRATSESGKPLAIGGDGILCVSCKAVVYRYEA
jgi:hypothetical protein